MLAELGVIWAGGGVGQLQYACCQPEGIYTSTQLSVVLYIMSPFAGANIASRSVRLIRGGRKPCDLEYTSNAADGSGTAVFIPTD